MASLIVPNASPDTDSKEPEFLELLSAARKQDSTAIGKLLQWYTNYLTILATTQLDRRLRRRMNPSDVVQEVMLAAHRDFRDFRGQSQGELLCWLRAILIHTLHRSFTTHIKVEKRDVRREVSLDELKSSLEESAYHLAQLLPAHVESPSEPLQSRERAVEFANGLSGLKPQYRDVIIMRILQGLSFDEIATRMERSPGAVRMLWLRALESFKTSSEGVIDESS